MDVAGRRKRSKPNWASRYEREEPSKGGVSFEWIVGLAILWVVGGLVSIFFVGLLTALIRDSLGDELGPLVVSLGWLANTFSINLILSGLAGLALARGMHRSRKALAVMLGAPGLHVVAIIVNVILIDVT